MSYKPHGSVGAHNFQKVLFAFACIVMSFFVCVPSAHATLLSPGATIAATAQTSLTGATQVGATLSLPFTSSTFSFSGTLTSQVWAGDTNNPFIGTNPGALTFTYLFANDPSSPDSIHRLTVNGYGTAGLLTDSSYSPGTVAPAFFDRSNGLGDVIGETFFSTPIGNGFVLPGNSSALWVVETNSSEANLSTAAVIDGGVATVGTYAPGAFNPVPEPSTFLLAAMGLIGLLALRSRRQCMA